MAKSIELEALRDVFRDPRVWIGVGQVEKIRMAQDRSVMLCEVKLFPNERSIQARVTWENVGPDSGIMGPPVVGDMVLLAYVEDETQAYIIRRLSSRIDTVPAEVAAGHTMVKSVAGKNVFVEGQEVDVTGASEINLQAPTINLGSGAEALVLGQQLKTLLENILSQIMFHTHNGPFTGATAAPNNNADFDSLMQGTGGILSQTSFTD